MSYKINQTLHSRTAVIAKSAAQASWHFMLKLYRLSESQAEAAALVGVNDIERRQHIHQLTLAVLAGCKQASQPFTWIRAAGLRSIAAALPVGLKDGQALMAVLEATYSQVLEVILSTLDRDLIPPNPAAARIAAACQQQLASKQDTCVDAAELLAAVDRFPAGYAPAAACTQELLEAFQLLQVLCLMSRKVRSLMSKAQHLQLITARACEAADCLPAAMKALLALLQDNEEAQGLFVTTGGLDMLLTRTLQHLSTQAETHTPSSAGQQQAGADIVSQGDTPAAATAAAARKHLAVELLLFLQLLQHWVIADAVNAGAHPSTQRAALALSVNHLGPDIAAALMQQEVPAAGSRRSNAGGSSSSSTGGAGPATSQASSPGGHPDELLLQARAEAAAERLLQQL